MPMANERDFSFLMHKNSTDCDYGCQMLQGSKREVQNQKGDQVLYFDKLSHKREIFLQPGR
jgi:hypothetical protein